ncbi:MAG: hypothetical protein K2I66_05480, partial [Bacteroidales bacterium]|nr:hypothetical protein [Bacteroidales bacterium]
VGEGCDIADSRLSESILQEEVCMRHTCAALSMFGKKSEISGAVSVFAMSDYSCVQGRQEE